jgi:hypothetical protein
VDARTDSPPIADLDVEVDLDATPPRTDLHDPQQRLEVERTIGTIPGMVGARLVPGFDREVDELHVLTSVDKTPKQAVRDVQTVLMARFGIPTDHRVISVVALDEGSLVAATSRVVIERVGLTQAGLGVTAEVVLIDGDERYVGTAEASASTKGRRRAVAAATLAAAAGLIGDECRVDLDGIDVADVVGQRVAVCVLQVRAAREELTLAGSALVRDAEPDAIAKSVLDALNRTISEAAD